jgi:dTDP-glucose pyrophosphorylase
LPIRYVISSATVSCPSTRRGNRRTPGKSQSRRGELEITDVQNAYPDADALHVERRAEALPGAWLDTGTFSLIDAASFVRLWSSVRA